MYKHSTMLRFALVMLAALTLFGCEQRLSETGAGAGLSKKQSSGSVFKRALANKAKKKSGTRNNGAATKRKTAAKRRKAAARKRRRTPARNGKARRRGGKRVAKASPRSRAGRNKTRNRD